MIAHSYAAMSSHRARAASGECRDTVPDVGENDDARTVLDRGWRGAVRIVAACGLAQFPLPSVAYGHADA
jgi:hypothetical protein